MPFEKYYCKAILYAYIENDGIKCCVTRFAVPNQQQEPFLQSKISPAKIQK